MREHPSPIVHLYEICLYTYDLYKKKEYNGRTIKRITLSHPRQNDIQRYKEKLLSEGTLEKPSYLPRECYLLSSSSHKEPADLACGIDPFCFISHLSAMEKHGLTDRFSKTLFLTSPPAPTWKDRAKQMIQRQLSVDIEDYETLNLYLPVRRIVKEIDKTPINVYVTKTADAGSYTLTGDSPTRISRIGRTFLDMLRNPELCGGINHVLEIYKERAKTYTKLIAAEIDTHGAPIDKVRAGFIFNNLCKISDNAIIEGWQIYAVRGGSRVLDSSAPFWSTYSEKWSLSINIDLP